MRPFKVGALVIVLIAVLVQSSPLFARPYDPRLGRFIQKDPIIWNRVTETYVYVKNSPPNFRDPFGLRPVTKAEEDLFTKTKATVVQRSPLQDAYAYHRATSDQKIDGAITEVRSAIEAIPESQPDPPPVKAIIWAMTQYTNPNAQQSYARGAQCPESGSSVTQFPAGEWKCNKFVADAYATGAGVGLSVGDRVHGEGKGKGYPAGRDTSGTWPPKANDLAQKGYNIRSLTSARNLDEQQTGNDPRAIASPGDIIAFPSPPSVSGHSALFFGNGLILSARGTGIEVGTISTEKQIHNDTVMIRKFTGTGR